jgi:hypothetical protein
MLEMFTSAFIELLKLHQAASGTSAQITTPAAIKLPRRKQLPDDAWLEEAAAACVYPTLPQTPVRDGSDDDAKTGTPTPGRKDNVYSIVGLNGTKYTTEPNTSLRGG